MTPFGRPYLQQIEAYDVFRDAQMTSFRNENRAYFPDARQVTPSDFLQAFQMTPPHPPNNATALMVRSLIVLAKSWRWQRAATENCLYRDLAGFA